MKLVSARWVVPVSRPPIDEGAVALADDGAVLAVGGRAELRAEFPDAPEERAQGVVLPGLVNAHCHLELSGHVDAVPGGKGLFAWATTLMGVRKADVPGRQRETAATAAAAAVALGTAAVGDVGNSLAAAPGSAARAWRACCSTSCSDRARSRPATRWRTRRASAPRPPPAGRSASATCRRPTPRSPSVPSCCARIFAAAAAAGRATSIHVAEDEDELALLRDGSGRWPALLAGMGVDPATRVPRKSPVAYLASLGAFETETPPLLVHMVHAGADDRRLAREAGATVVLCPRSNLHIGGRLPDVDALVADGLAARDRHRQPRLRARPVAVGRDGDAGRALPRRPGGALAGRRHARRRARARASAGSARSSPARAPACSTCWSTTSPPRWNRWCAIRHPTLRWVARA